MNKQEQQRSALGIALEVGKVSAISAFVGATAVVGAKIMTNEEPTNLLRELPQMPYNETAQQLVSNLDIAVGVPGFVGLCAVSALIVGNRVTSKLGGSRRAARAEMIHKLSSRELSTSAGKKSRSPRRGSWLGTGKLPVVTATGVLVASLCNMIGNEITDGPQRPIDSVAREVGAVNFRSLIAQDKGANPMGDSAISEKAVRQIAIDAQRNDVTIVPMSKNLGTVTFEDNDKVPELLGTKNNGYRTISTLTFGVPVEKDSVLAYEDEKCIEPVPVTVDTSAIFIPTNGAKLNGMYIKVVGEEEDISVMNRIGVIADGRGLKCISKNNNSHIIGLSTDQKTAAAILEQAAPDEIATVITFDKYKNNSREFWKANSKPITNVIALLAMVMAGVATGGGLRLRIEKSRREMAALLASGVSTATLRSVEALRVAKDAVVATVTGVVGAAAIAPFTSSVVYGLQLHISPKDVFVGAGAAMIGAATSFARAFASKKRILKAIDPSEATQ